MSKNSTNETQQLIRSAEMYFEKMHLNEAMDNFLREPECYEVIKTELAKCEEAFQERFKRLPESYQQDILARKKRPELIPEPFFIDIVKTACKVVILEAIQLFQQQKPNISDEEMAQKVKATMDSKFTKDNLEMVKFYASRAAKSMVEINDGIARGEIQL